MKIHPNNQISDMLDNGTAKVINHKFLRYSRTDGNTAVAAAPDDALAAVLRTISVILPETEPDILPGLLLPPALSEAIPPPAEPAVAAEVILPPAEPVVMIEITQPAELIPVPEAAALAELAAAVSPAEPAAAESIPAVWVSVIQPESAPGGLIAEIHMESGSSVQGLDALGAALNIPSAPAHSAAYGSFPYLQTEEDASYPPYVNYIAFNRLGLTIKNLTNLLDSSEDFELNIIDCHSKDNSWDYIQSLTDPRIKSRIRFDLNCGPIYAVNFGLARRKPYQYFIVVDSDTFIKTKNWIARFMEVFNAFPDVGLLGLMRDNPYPRYLPPIIPRVNGALSYLELKNADITAQMDFVPGQLQCLRPGLIKEIGYWSEENGFGDAELSPRIVHYTNYKAGFITTVDIDMTQKIPCSECMGKQFCTLSRSVSDCFSISRMYNKNESFVTKNTWKFTETFRELQEGQRTAYCASIHDPVSIQNHKYNMDWALDNFNHYIVNAN